MATEIIAGPLDVYTAPVGTGFPKIQDDPAAPWTRIGTSGTRNMTEDGLSIGHPQEFYEVKVAGSTVTQKVFRTGEGLSIAFTLYDIKAVEYSRLLNDNVPAVVPAASGVAGETSVNLYRDVQVKFSALLVRGKASPEQEGANAQYEVPKVWQNGSPTVVYTKGEAAGLAFEFMALFDNDNATAGLGTYRYQTANATS